MVSADSWLGTRFGCYAAVAHLLLAGASAIAVAAGGPASAERWMFIGILDTPMNLLFFPFLKHAPFGLSDDAFTYLYFFVVGTAFWYCLGWLFGHVTHRVRHGSW